jgi:GNAT superfamily N-acetyltransferase
MSAMGNETVVLRDDDPRRDDLESRGYTVVGQSWGARLELADPPDLSIVRRALDRVTAAGVSVSELPMTAADDLYELEKANNGDYPFTPATSHDLLDADATRELWSQGFRVFGAYDGGRLLGATLIVHRGTHAETEFTSVLAARRGAGIGAAVKAASILACATDGARVSGTGGAAANGASLGVNQALGYVVTERWYSYRAP